jgi:exodeoxyribonuclease VII large subunit
MTTVAGTDDGADVQVWAIGDLNRRARHAVVREFRGQVHVGGELTRLEDRRGNRFLELVERGGGRDGRDAHLQAFCSATRWLKLQRKLGEAGVDLRVGQRLVIVGSLEVGDRGNLSLNLVDVDVAALVGERLAARRQLVQRLLDDDLFDANRRLPPPPLPLRIGLVASVGSDGHRDLVRQLDASGFAFEVTLRSVPVEGPLAPRAIRAALATFGRHDTDVAVIVRGGGAKASLDVFDAALVAHAIATAAVPVWTGIGHAGDRTVADEVAHRCCATPSMVGQALVAVVAGALDAVARSVARVGRLVDAGLVRTGLEVDGQWRTISTLARSQLARHDQTRARAAVDVRRGAVRALDARGAQLTAAAGRIRAAGSAELRDAERRLAGLALDSASAAGRRCVDSAAELAAAAAAVPGAAAASLTAAGGPIRQAGARLRPERFAGLVDDQGAVVATAAHAAGRHVRRRLDADGDRAASRRAVLEAYDPRRQLGRGWTLTHTADGRLVRRAAELSAGDGLVTTFADGAARSTVTQVTPAADKDGPDD